MTAVYAVLYTGEQVPAEDAVVGITDNYQRAEQIISEDIEDQGEGGPTESSYDIVMYELNRKVV